MVGRELQKIRPYGEDHLGLIRGRDGVVQVSIHKNGMTIDGLKN